MSILYSAAMEIMRVALGRRNQNDPDSNDDKLLQYVKDFVTLTMCNDIKVFEQYGTYEFTIDETSTDGVIQFNENDDFINIGGQGFVSLTTQPTDSTSWNQIWIYQDPMQFYQKWGVNNEDVLIRGYPTEMLFYGNEIVVRTLPEQSYTIQIYGYKKVMDADVQPNKGLPYDWWLRYIAYGAARDYAVDYRLSESTKQSIDREFNKQKKLMLKRTHGQRKPSSCQPRF